MGDNLGRFQSSSPDTPAVVAEADLADGIVGRSALAGALDGNVGGPGGIGVHGLNGQPGGIGVQGEGGSVGGVGVIGVSDHRGVWGQGGNTGVMGTSDQTGVEGFSTYGTGVYGATDGPQASGVSGLSTTNGQGVSGSCDVGTGVWGSSDSGVGVRGESNSGNGVQGRGNGGVVAFNSSNEHAAYLATDCCGAWINGDSVIYGSLYVDGPILKHGGGFLIDHPDAPAERYLTHSFVESSERKNIYDGVTVLGDDGRATVSVPDWFEGLNSGVRYQLTCVGAPAPGLHVAAELADGRFEIAGGPAGLKVCWQLTATRTDPWALANPVEVEAEKTAEERGRYLNPALYGFGSEKHIAALAKPSVL